jgi:hypothetical protein
MAASSTLGILHHAAQAGADQQQARLAKLFPAQGRFKICSRSAGVIRALPPQSTQTFCRNGKRLLRKRAGFSLP